MPTAALAERSAQMRKVKAKDTRPELIVRSLLHRLGYRFRLHDDSLSGKPDIVFRSRKKVVFIHGCFWHRHNDVSCRLTRMPKSRLEYWVPKFQRNELRDQRTRSGLIAAGWQVFTIWECEVRGSDLSRIESRLQTFLGPPRHGRL